MHKHIGEASPSSSSWFNWFLLESCNSICLPDYSKGSYYENSLKQNLKFIERDREKITVSFSQDNKQISKMISNKENQDNNNKTLSPSPSSNNKIIKQSTSPMNLINKFNINDRPFDVIIFGASSSVGYFLIEEMALVSEKYYSNKSNEQKTITSTLDIKEFRDQFAQKQHLNNNNNNNNKRFSVPRHINDDGFNWAIAGRSAIKLQESLCKAELSTGIKDLSNKIPIILADLQQHKSLIDMCSKTKLLFNCAGPYSIDGEAIIKACLYSKTNYLDLSNETKFIDKIRKKYHKLAKENEIFIINGCGFQSMSAELGLNYIKQIVDGQINEIKIILNLSDTSALVKKSNNSEIKCKPLGLISWGMWNSLLIDKSQQNFSSNEFDKREEKDSLLYCEKHDNKIKSNKSKEEEKNADNDNNNKQLIRRDTQNLVSELIELKNKNKLKVSFNLFQLIRTFFIDYYYSKSSGYCLPINSITSEQEQLIRGEMTNYEERNLDLNNELLCWKPIRSISFISIKSLFNTIIIFLWLFIFDNILIKFSLFRKLMRFFPSIISFGNVTNNKNSRQLDRDSLNHIKFSQTFLVYGEPGLDSGNPFEKIDNQNTRRKQEQLLVARIVGPEPNHLTTATLAIQACLTVLLERDHLPTNGGVLTPGTAFYDTNIIYQLRRRNIKFEVLKKA